ncbi:MAG: hypothetical protein UW47_C0007G0029 [Candidatus Woesebacteria bacterium GW2011_GWA1_44_23]|uniref:Phosphoribulokinase/uridine kinase domain-containing protein n=1 Tax=Candidatus Woesebacteria bacterium GW2011_GWA1_44_23 TaxID=1618558 RepID=A0A837I8P6_9BACT|nr:MAG: hypothetical protein UW47_C0007G0029 [Candidatus Woesebacteria bacterium GW2011_GWA1_44_23]
MSNEMIANRAFVIAVSGASAAGKSTISTILSSEIPQCTVLNMDDYLKGWGIGLLNHDSGNPNRPYFARLNPNVYDLKKLHEDLIQLKDGKSIEKPVFDEIMKRPCGIRIFEPSKVLVLDGIYSLESPFLELGDVPILIEASLHDRLFRKVVRNSISYKQDINDIIHTYLTDDEPTYPYYKDEFRAKARLIVNNSSNPVRDFAIYPGKQTAIYPGIGSNIIPKTENGTLHMGERLEIVWSHDEQRSLMYTVGNKVLINNIINPDTYELLKNYYEVK